MIREYLSSLEECYGYTGNWQPNCPVHVGDWADVERGFLPWLKEFLGISYKSLEINKNLHSVISGSLGDIDTKKEKRASMVLSHNVSMDMSGSGQMLNIKAQKKGGFFAAFQDIVEYNAMPDAFQEKLHNLDKASVAIISGATYAKKGIIVVFNTNAASLSLSADSSLEALMDRPALIDMNFHVAYECAGVAVYQAEPTKPLMPFVKIHIAEQDKQNGFQGHLPSLKEDYDITPFSYISFFGQN